MAHYRVAARWRSAFAKFIMAYGVARLAKELQIRDSAIYHWIGARSVPRPAYAATIQRLARKSRVKLTLDQIYQHSAAVRARECEAAAAPHFAGTAAPRDQARAHVREVPASL